jgi:hypothetical protein
MEEFALDLRGDEVFSAQIEMLIKIAAMQKSIASLLCDKFAKTPEESDELFQSVVDDSNTYSSEIMRDLYARRGHINIGNILPRKK